MAESTPNTVSSTRLYLGNLPRNGTLLVGTLEEHGRASLLGTG